jgi:hypothetical protein
MTELVELQLLIQPFPRNMPVAVSATLARPTIDAAVPPTPTTAAAAVVPPPATPRGKIVEYHLKIVEYHYFQ